MSVIVQQSTKIYFKLMLIKSVNGISPSIPSDCYVAENATIVGAVTLEESCSVWFNAVIRGDVNSIHWK
jgi:carbonic anhydrase/acetyltransferase-like protein (isoleucine patch superfamily)